MKKLSAISLAALLVAFSSNANARDNNYYVQLNLGSTTINKMGYDGVVGGSNQYGDNDLGTEFTWGAAAGKHVTPNIRVELEGRYTNGNSETTTRVAGLTATGKRDINVTEGFLNGYYDFHPTVVPFTPYFVAGVGAVNLEFDRNGATDLDETNFAFQVGVGADYKITDRISTNLTYKYVNAPDEFDFAISATARESWDYDAHNVNVGLKYNF